VNPLDQWTADVIEALQLDPDAYDRDLLLDLTRDVAHGVARPAAPLTAYLVGVAVGASGGGAAQLQDVVRRIQALMSGPEREHPWH
jgi:hypothetical protein